MEFLERIQFKLYLSNNMSQENLSTIRIDNLSIHLKSSQFSDLINNTLKSALQGKEHFTVSVLNDQEILITPVPEVVINIQGNKIVGTMPLHIDTNLKGPVKRVSVQTDIIAHIEVEITRQDERNLTIQSNITEIEWTDDIDIQPPLLDFVLRDSFVKDMVEKQLPAINGKINETLKELANFKTLLSRVVWKRSIRIPLKNQQEMFLSVWPEVIEINKIGFDNDNIQLSCNLSGGMVPSETDVMIDEHFVPDLLFLDKYAPGDEMTVDIRLNMASLGAPALKVVKSIPNIENAIRCNIEKIILRPVGTDGLAIGLKLKGALNGGMSIAGRPSVDQDTLKLNIENLTFDFSGKNMLSSLTGNIALSLAKSVIRKQFPIPLKPYIENLIQTANETISSLRLMDGMVVKGNVGAWNLGELKVTDGYLMVVFRTEVLTYLSPE